MRRRWPSFQFEHCYGLGVLAVGSKPSPIVGALCASAGTRGEAALRRLFTVIGERWMADQAMREATARQVAPTPAG